MKKIISFVLVLLLIAGYPTSSAAVAPSLGELTGDGKITADDALVAAKMAVGMLPPSSTADVDGSGDVTIADAFYILQYAAGKISSFEGLIREQLIIEFIDVGQGDGILLRKGSHAAIIDSGNYTTSAAKIVRDYLLAANISHLDFALFTHPDADHIGGGANVLSAISCDRVYMPFFREAMAPTSKTFLSLAMVIEQRDIPLQNLKAGDSFDFAGVEMNVLAPSQSMLDTTKKTNNLSIALIADYFDFEIYLGGDAEKESEAEMLAAGAVPKVEVAKCSHHGSDTSNTPDFINALGASDWVISCGLGNTYGHPKPAILERLAGKRLWRTDTQGTITCKSDGVYWGIKAEK